MSELKPIETRYEGCQFRSRLEARWAFYFDYLGIEWEYEKEGFQLPSGWYVPDFWLPQVKMWAEVKPGEFANVEMQKCFELKESCLLLDGPPSDREYCVEEPEFGGDGGYRYAGYVLGPSYLHEHRFYMGDFHSWPFGLTERTNDYQVSFAARAAKYHRFW